MNEQHFREALILWYETHKRTLPWRDTNDAYRIWLSEIILQQTRVVQGYDYYLRFIERFPTIQSLASANEEDVLHLWQGLGYYTRARNLHTTAKYISEHYHNTFPSSYTEILQLKGIGPYTAAAIASFAFNLPYAAVDGNVQRVLARLFFIDTPINTPKGTKIIQEKAFQLLDKAHPAQHNQALIELGALVCLPHNPQCSDCPVREFCSAFSIGKAELLPTKERNISIKERYFTYFRIDCHGETLLVQRTQKDIWRNLYEYPLLETQQTSSIEEVKESELFKELTHKNKFTIRKVVSNLTHQLSHQRLHVFLYELTLQHLPLLPFPFRIVKRGEESTLPISRLMEILIYSPVRN